jgi:hypothetical protein
VDAELVAADGGPACPRNSFVEFVLSENQFSPPLWTGEWVNGILPDDNRPGLVHVRIPRDFTKTLRRGSYMYSIRVGDRMRYAFNTQLVGYFLVECMPSSDQRSIPYRDGTSEIFSGGQDKEDDVSSDIEKLREEVAALDKKKADKDALSGTSMSVKDVESVRESLAATAEALGARVEWDSH